MKPNLLKEERSGWPAQSRPDRKLPEPWTIELLVSINRVHHHALSPKEDQIAFVWEREGNSDLWLAGTDGGGWAQRLTFDRPVHNYWEDASPRWSPDGEWVVFASQGDAWSVPSAGGKARRLTDYQTGDSSPIFSPGGERIYYLSRRRVFDNLCYTTLDGDWPTPVTRFEADVSDPQPAPDGKRVAFAYQPQDDLNRSQICLVPAMGGDVQHLTGAAEVWDSFPRWLPGGKHVAFLSNRSGWQELYLFNIAKNDLQQLTALNADVQEFAMHPGGDRIALVVNNQGIGDLYILELESLDARRLRAERGWHRLPQWSPDGTWLTVEFESPVQPPDIYRIAADTGEARQLTSSMPPTLALTLMGLETPTEGTVVFDGQDITGLKGQAMKEIRRHIQMVFQDPYESLNPLITVGELVAEPLLVHKLTQSTTERARQVRQALRDAGLKPARTFVNRFPHELSGGQRQRVVIAGTLVLEPTILLADEPVSMLDVSIRAEILSLLAELRVRRGISILFITHDLATAAFFANRVAVMYLGRIVEISTTREVLTNPAHPYTKALLSVIPVPNPRQRRERIILQGDPPNPIDLPPGCRFHPRCPLAQSICREQDPVLKEVSPGHQAACLLL